MHSIPKILFYFYDVFRGTVRYPVKCMGESGFYGTVITSLFYQKIIKISNLNFYMNHFLTNFWQGISLHVYVFLTFSHFKPYFLINIFFLI